MLALQLPSSWFTSAQPFPDERLNESLASGGVRIKCMFGRVANFDLCTYASVGGKKTLTTNISTIVYFIFLICYFFVICCLKMKNSSDPSYISF